MIQIEPQNWGKDQSKMLKSKLQIMRESILGKEKSDGRVQFGIKRFLAGGGELDPNNEAEPQKPIWLGAGACSRPDIQTSTKISSQRGRE